MRNHVLKVAGIASVLLSIATMLTPLSTYAETGPGGYTLGVGNYGEIEPGFEGLIHKPSYDDTICESNPGSEFKCANDSLDAARKVEVTIPETLGIISAKFTDKDGGSYVVVAPNMINEDGKIIANVYSNVDYTLSLSATNPPLYNEAEEAFIPALAAGTTTLTKGKTAWGVKKYADAPGVYTGLTALDQLFYENPVADSSSYGNVSIEFPVGVSASMKTVDGTYKTTVKVTVAPKI